MKLTELQRQINNKANEIKSSYKSGIKGDLAQIINQIFAEANIAAHAYYDYTDRSNLIKIAPKGKYDRETNWPIYVEYKTQRTLLEKSYYMGNSYEYKIKSVSIEKQGKRKVEEGKEIEIETIEDFLRAEELWTNRRNHQQENEIAELKTFIAKNPEFERMTELYAKYKYNLK